MHALAEMQTLALSRPAIDADATEVAAWYERKAHLFDQLAREGDSTAPMQARAARIHARELVGRAAA